MRLVWVTTKAPWPPRDGGRLLVAQTVAALVQRGHRVRVVAAHPRDEPSSAALAVAYAAGVELELVTSVPGGWSAAVASSLVTGRAITFLRHAHPALRPVLERALEEQRVDALVAEQPQLFGVCQAASRGRVPVVVRAQNVESQLWLGLASTLPMGLATLVRVEARRVARAEARVARLAACTVAASSEDQAALRREAGPGVDIAHISAPFPAVLEAGGERLPGSPAFVLVGTEGWAPNRDGARWFVREVWPGVARARTAAELHVFGGGFLGSAAVPPGVRIHPAPPESGDAFAADSVLVVPLRVASGVRMKILEAWARGVPVIATRAAAGGLGIEHRRELLLADTPDEFVGAAAILSTEPELRSSLVAAGRRCLRADHDPVRIAAAWEELLSAVADARPNP